MAAREVLARLEQVIGLSGSPVRLKDVLEEQLSCYFGLPPIRAAEEAEALEKSVLGRIITNQQECEGVGSLPILTVPDAGQRYVCGSCWIAPTDSEDIRRSKANRIQVQPVLEHIQNLTFGEFELFGAAILRQLGASQVNVTPRSNDQGIDFYGILRLGDLGATHFPFLRLAHDITIRFAGQAKHYPTAAIGPNVIRELIGSISLARFQVFTREPEIFDELALLPFNPLMGMVFTTGRFTRGAVRIADRSGILARSGEQLAVFLADCGVGLVDGTFSAPHFERWLRSEGVH